MSRQKNNVEDGERNTADRNSAMSVSFGLVMVSELRVSSQAPCGGPIFLADSTILSLTFPHIIK